MLLLRLLLPLFIANNVSGGFSPPERKAKFVCHLPAIVSEAARHAPGGGFDVATFVHIEIAQGGEFYWEGQRVDMQRLRHYMSSASSDIPQPVIQINAEDGVRIAEFAPVLGAISSSGTEFLAFERKQVSWSRSLLIICRLPEKVRNAGPRDDGPPVSARVILERDGTIFWNETRVTMSAFLHRLTLAASDRQHSIIVHPRGDVPYGRLAPVLRAIEQKDIPTTRFEFGD